MNNVDKKSQHTFVVYMEDKPGVLNRAVSLFRRRGFNIHSLSVGPSGQPDVSRMTVVVDIDSIGARLVEANLYKLINVLWVEDVTHSPTVSRELALIKVRATGEERNQVLQTIDVFRARVVDMASESLITEITGTSEKIRGFIQVLEPFGILSVARAGTVAMRRGGESACVVWDGTPHSVTRGKNLEPYTYDDPETPALVGAPVSESYSGVLKRSN